MPRPFWNHFLIIQQNRWKALTPLSTQRADRATPLIVAVNDLRLTTSGNAHTWRSFKDVAAIITSIDLAGKQAPAISRLRAYDLEQPEKLIDNPTIGFPPDYDDWILAFANHRETWRMH